MREKPSDLPFFLSGICSTGGALVVEAILEQRGLTLVGTYWETVPVGAVALGMLSATGFGYGSRKFASRIGGLNFLGVFAILTLGYLGAQWLLYRHVLPGGLTEQGDPVSFSTWFDSVTRRSYIDHGDGTAGQALGVGGYVWRLFELMAVAISTFLLPLFLGVPYCFACNRNMQSRCLLTAPIGPDGMIIGDRAPEHMQSSKAWREAIHEVFNSAKDSISLREALRKHDQKRGGPLKMVIELVHCRQCFAGKLLARLFERQAMGWQKKLVGKQELQPQVVGEMLSG